jgi:Tfp pilus assembly protein PilN
MSTKTTKKKTVSKKTSESELTDLISLCDALVAEIDNLMSSNLQPAQVGKVLGDVITSFSKQVDSFKK